MSATISDEKLKWVFELTDVLPASLKAPAKPLGTGGKTHEDTEAKKKTKLAEIMEEEDEKIEALKELAIADVLRMIKPLKPVLKEYYDFEITNAEGETFQAQAKTGDLAQTGDTSDLAGGGTAKSKQPGVDGATLQKQVMAAQNTLITLQKQLEQKTFARTVDLGEDLKTKIAGPAERIFTDDEISDEIYTPLIREKIMAPHLVEGKFSRVQKMLDGSNKLYKAELKTSTADVNSNVASILKLAVNTAGSMVQGILAMDGIDTAMVNDLLSGATELANLTIDFGNKARAGVDVNSVTTFLNGLPSIVGGIVGDALGSSEIGEFISVGAGAATQAIGMIATSIKAGEVNKGALIQFGASLINIGLTKEGVDASNDKASDLFSLGQTLSTDLGDALGAQANAFFDAAKAGDSKRMRQLIMGTVKDVVVNKLPGLVSSVVEVQTASSTSSSTDSKKINLEMTEIVEGKSTLSQSDQQDVITQYNENQQSSELTSGLNTIASTISGVSDLKKDKDESDEKAKKALELEEAFKKKLEMAELNAEQYEKEREKLDKELNEHPDKLAESLRKDLDKERKEFNEQLKGLNDPSVDHKTIDKLMAQIRRDRAIMGMAVAIGKGGFEVASKFLAPLSIGNEAIKMALNIKAVVERAADLRAFVDESIGATNAVSEYLSSIQNFVDNQENQLDQYSIRIALNAANIAASIAATAFPLAAPAVIVVGAAQSSAELIFAVQSETRVRKAWNLTLKAFANPTNRRLGLMVRKFNPTLAKYTVAYGAMVEGDPIAMSMCNACGIDNDTLKNESSNAQKVKDFLELKFKDDEKVAFKYEDPATWVNDLPDAKLDAGCVLHTYKVIADGFAKDTSEATQKKVDKVGAISPQPKELVPLVKEVGLIDVAKLEQQDDKQIKTALMMIDRVINGFRAEGQRFAPLGTDASNAVEAFGELAEPLQNKVVMMMLRKLKNAPPQQTK